MAMFLSALTFSTIWGQEAGLEGSVPGGEELKENLALFTDRNTYIAGEKILFTIFNCSPRSLKELEWSKIVYVELISADNEAVIQEKFKFSPDGARGALDIPRSPLSGIYILRAYTRWMRNFPAESYACQRIRIINPYSPGIIIAEEEDSGEESLRNPLPARQGKMFVADLTTSRKIYGNREKVEIFGSLPNEGMDNLSGLCLTVVRKAALDSIVNLEFIPSTPEKSKDVFVPEIRGMAVIGKVVDKKMRTPVPDARVHLSHMGEEHYYLGFQTGADGKFYIPIKDFTGTRDFYIGAETRWEDDIEILIDQDFSTDQTIVKHDKFIVHDNEKPVLEEMIINAQVNTLYVAPRPQENSVTEYIQKPEGLNFYGKPWFKLMIEDYVKLPSLGEFIFELVPQATIQRKKGKSQLNIYGEYGNLLIYDPLILLDHVAISDVSSILHVSPEKIRSIEVINATYIYGNIKYGGILSIESRNHDLAGVDLPADSYFFGFRTLSEPVEINFPEYPDDKGDLRNPDFRNCLCWVPQLQVDESGRFHSSFYTSDRMGEYIVVVRGSTSGGEEIYGLTEIMVQ